MLLQILAMRIFIVSVLVLSLFEVNGQSVINAYAKVTNVAGATLSLSNINETNDTFEAGEKVIVMQMQDDIIGGNTGNDTNFGNISTIANAGLWEEAIIQSVGESLGAAEDIYLETFEGLAQGTISDGAPTGWSRTCGSCGTGGRYFEVRNDAAIGGSRLFAGNMITETGIWTSDVINVSGYVNVSVAVAIAQSGFDAADANDNITVSYSLDGGSFTTVGSRNGNFTAVTLSANVPTAASTLRVRVVVNSNAAGDIGKFDNVTVQGRRYLLNSVTLNSPLSNTYSTTANSSLQIISFPEFTNYTTSSNLTALDWNGNIGGVFAIDVTNTLTLGHNISVNAQGFRGGVTNPTADGSGCDAVTFITNTDNYARKGEGVYKVTTTNYRSGRAKVVNGGGGGNFHNAGGGGGGNFTAGGMGGNGWNGSAGGCNPSGGGQGGLDLGEHISAYRIFMGGGGGGGQQNNGVATAGGDGGGVIIIRASVLKTNLGCGGVSITANGANVTTSGNDGGGGAGAGGTVMFQVNTWDAACQITNEARGGNGGSVNNGATHGGGGGGGKGVIIYAGSSPVANVSASNLQGSGGNNNTSGSSQAPPGEGAPLSSSDPDGVYEVPVSPLPVELLNWSAKEVDNQVLLTWVTVSEKNNHFFTIERSSDAKNWSVLQLVEGAGTTNEKRYYDLLDEKPIAATNYYRLSQTDYDGTTEVFRVIAVELDIFATNLLLYPNPSSGVFRIKLPDVLPDAQYELIMFDINGQIVSADVRQEWGELVVNANSLRTGYYFVRVAMGDHYQNLKVIID